MKIEYRTGDLIASNIKVIAHGCNSLGVMGAGIAAQIKAKYPICFETYLARYVTNSLKLGDLVWYHRGNRIIANMITQDKVGRDPQIVYCSYDAIGECMYKANQTAKSGLLGEVMMPLIGMPLIGAGLANGSWNKIAGIIEAESTAFQPVVYLYDGTMPTT